MRIAFLSRRYWPAVSGMSVYAENLLRQLARLGHDVVMISQYRDDAAGRGIYGGGPPPEVPGVQVPGVQVMGLQSHGEERIGAGQPADFERDIEAMTQAVLSEHRKLPFDIVHAQYAYPTGLAALYAAQACGLPCLVSIQGGDGHWVGQCCATHKQAMLTVLDQADRLLIGSRSFAEEVQAHHGTPMERFTIVPGATDTQFFSPSAEPHDGPIRLLYHGRIDRRKGLMELLEAAELLLERRRDFRLTISGIGPDLDEVARRVEASRLRACTRLPGFSAYHDAPDIYRDADIFVSPTYSEGFSNTILEAMASRLAIVSTRTVGVVDCLRHDENALLVPIQTVEPLAQAIGALMDDRALRRRLADAGYDDVTQHYAWPVVAGQIVNEYASAQMEPRQTRLADPVFRSFAAADLTCRFRTAPHLL